MTVLCGLPKSTLSSYSKSYSDKTRPSHKFKDRNFSIESLFQSSPEVDREKCVNTIGVHWLCQVYIVLKHGKAPGELGHDA